MPKTYIIVPCYNEANRLQKQIFVDFARNNNDFHFLFVNDGSSDNTQTMLEILTQETENIHLLALKQNSGKAEAVRQGMMWTAQNTDANFIGFWDADLATPLYELENFSKLITTNNFDIITGLRLVRLGAHVKRKKSRHYIGRIFATITSNILKVGVYDTQCGAKLYKAEIVPLLFSEQFVTRWLFDVEILARYICEFGKARTEEKVYEYPIMTWEDIGGSRLKTSDFLKAPLELLKIYRLYKSGLKKL